MDNWKKYSIALLFCCGLSSTVQAQQNKPLYGQVIDQDTRRPLAAITIVNKRTKQRTTTNDSGDFFIWASPGDSVLTSAIGYADGGIWVDGITKKPVIPLKRTAIQLDEVVVREKKSENLRKEIDSFLANPYGSQEIRQEIMRNMISAQPTSPGLGISVDAIYDLFSKEGKSKRKLADLQMADARKYYALLRYNPSLVSHITGLKGPQLEAFMRYCFLTEDFILRATDYELTYEINQCLRDFKK